MIEESKAPNPSRSRVKRRDEATVRGCAGRFLPVLLFLLSVSAAVAESESERQGKLAALLGVRRNAPIAARRWERWQDYYEKSLFGKAMLHFFTKERSIVDDPKRGLFVSAEAAVRPSDYKPTMMVYCPQSYDGAMKMGVYIHIEPGNAAMTPSEGYQEVMDSARCIFASPNGVGNNQGDMRRVAVTLDALAQLRKDYTIDENRVYVGGTSGGGAESVLATICYPKDFRGCVDAVRDFTFLSQRCLPFAKPADVHKSKKYGQPLAFVTGPQDFNYPRIQRSIPDWKHKGFTVRLFDVPGMKHESAPPATLKEALKWIDANGPRGRSRER
jgi:hypothetical protein